MIEQFIIDNYITLIVYFVILIVLFFLIREVLTWYWKLNKIVSTLDEIRNDTSNLVKISKLFLDKEKLNTLKEELKETTNSDLNIESKTSK